ncbi:VWA domain-containing protein [Conexibacter sp. JD483]|uniref:vWA domain-containing protein n=1 Tax=unclassified Conexibacter TaxID=2627773 RepID=UPI0027268ADE|nr:MULTISPECIES: VWA domain-containing protein [unclassified Conexibacter]MDO8187756.1 VWA domain-containing protein [Conexibacter sp. CPCC 205706]MDO8201365.1 VWA domain-containing protein [Conexibacter sp. CPCC 205762]MDR9372769.1 VWA domain-containing protein [Conexibacter sp. JD483]
MKKSQLFIVVAAIAAVAVMALVASGGGGGGGDSSTTADRDGTPAAPAGAVVVDIAYSPEKAQLLEAAIDDYNRTDPRVNGRAVFVRGRSVSSGDAQVDIAAGRLRPTVWSPASSMWGRLLTFESDRGYVPEESPSIVRTPLVIAMWEPMARALGWPRRAIGFADVLRLAQADRGWEQFGHPEFGDFKLVHTNPDYSTSGLSGVVAEYYAATGKKEGLTEADVDRSRSSVRAIESAIVHYGDTTLFIADQLRRSGPGYASAVFMEEATLVDFNQRRGSGDKLVAIYPSEGTFYSDSPYIVLNAPWVSADQRAAAEQFATWLDGNLTPELAGRYGFRPGALEQRPAGSLTAANGVDTAQPRRVLGVPEPRVLAKLKDTWRADRKPANVLLVLDTSGSMNDEKRLENAKRGLQAFLREAAPQDRIGLTAFNEETRDLVPIAPMSGNRAKLRQTVDGLVSDGGTAAYDAVDHAVDTVRGMADRDHINAVVVLTDGEDTDSGISARSLVDKLAAQGDSTSHVRVFTIAYGNSVAGGAKEQMAAIAEASGGLAYEGSTDDIDQVYRSISSFF